MDPRIEQIETGIKLIDKIVKAIKTPVDKNSAKEIKDSTKILKEKLKLLKKDENLAIQYTDRTAFDTIQGVFQAFHLYIISTDEEKLVGEIMDWLRGHENCYAIANRMQAAANARADFNGANKR